MTAKPSNRTKDRPENESWLLVSDLDDTLLGDDDALERFRQFYDETQPQLGVIYASGRFCDSIDDDVGRTALPEPLATIGGVGSEIWLYPERRPLEEWWEKISSDWSAEKVREVLGNEADLELQSDENQSPYKVSYYLHQATPERLRELEAKLIEVGINTDYIYSSQRDLDFLPAGVNKGTAAAFLVDFLKQSRDTVFAAGNSGNDATLFERDFSGIIVANADEDLKKYGDNDSIYQAGAAHADGVREGIVHWMDGKEEVVMSASSSRKEEGYDKAVELLHRCNTEHGFLATPTARDNYRRIWGRDGSIIGLAALMTGDDELEEGCRRTLETLARHQGAHGEIPSNVDPETNRISYGGTAGRVDANLWFVLACSEYWRRTADDEFLNQMIEPLEKVRFLLGSWEFNTRGLLYIPPTGDWADEYLQSGYVLYDQILYLQAQKQFCCIHRHIHGSDDHELEDRVSRLRSLIRTNYWFHEEDDDQHDDGYIYHEVLFEKGRDASPHQLGCFWMPFFSPFGYGYRFDAMANVLISLFDVADETQSGKVDQFIDSKIVDDDVGLLPAFWPVITPKHEKWDDLQMSFSHTFKNAPHEYHNGGLWPLIAGLYVASMARRGQTERAERYRKALHRANRLEMDGEAWSFPEFVHGKEHTPGGTHPMGWSAAAAIIAEKYIQGERLFGDPCPARASSSTESDTETPKKG